MPKLFISYRRDDSAYAAQQIRDKLADHYGKESVVFDVDSIPKGFDFVEYLNQQVSKCDVLLAVIGDDWIDVRAADGSRRIENPEDFVRIEIRAALKRKIPVIPVLVGNCSIPSSASLPDDIKPLRRRNASEVRSGRDLETDLERLVKDIEDSLKYVSQTQPPAVDEQAIQSLPESPPPQERQVAAEKKRRWWIPISAIGVMLLAVLLILFYPNGGPDIEFVRVEPGEFVMGSPEAGRKQHDVQHQVILTKRFELGKYEVTQAQYEEVVNENSSKFKNDSAPVENVSWFDAIEFCNRLSRLEGSPPYYKVDGEHVTVLGGVGYRLPTEAEWEYACRAGSKGAYCFGDDRTELDQYAWFGENPEEGTTHPVGEKQPNAWGLYDMHGNVWEWCWDWYDKDYYRTSPKENPSGPPTGSARVYRGGGWIDDAGGCRSACRDWGDPEFRRSGLGFRLARSCVQQDKPGSED